MELLKHILLYYTELNDSVEKNKGNDDSILPELLRMFNLASPTIACTKRASQKPERELWNFKTVQGGM